MCDGRPAEQAAPRLLKLTVRIRQLPRVEAGDVTDGKPKLPLLRVRRGTGATTHDQACYALKTVLPREPAIFLCTRREAMAGPGFSRDTHAHAHADARAHKSHTHQVDVTDAVDAGDTALLVRELLGHVETPRILANDVVVVEPSGPCFPGLLCRRGGRRHFRNLGARRHGWCGCLIKSSRAGGIHTAGRFCLSCSDIRSLWIFLFLESDGCLSLILWYEIAEVVLPHEQVYLSALMPNSCAAL